MEHIYEIKIVSIENMPQYIRSKIIEDVKTKGGDFKNNFKGFAKVTYVTNSPKSIKSIEPIEGTIIDFYNMITQSQGVVIPEF
ncbi:hypothetical protein HQ531_02760 [bacterium]|nr:hypothetical protein [bacterium]